jgi:hypothetical protein
MSASEKYFRERKIEFDALDPTSSQFFITSKSQADGYYNQNILYRELINEEIFKDISTDGDSFTDLAKFGKHLKLMKGNPTVWKQYLKIADILPTGHPLNLYLTQDQNYTDTWQQPVIGSHVIDQRLQCAEISIPHFDKVNFDASVQGFYECVNYSKHALFNVSPLCFSVETVDIPKSQYRNLVKERHSGNTINFSAEGDNNTIKVPTRFVIGGGRNTAMVFKFGLSEIKDVNNKDKCSGNFYFEYSQIPQEVIDFWKQLPPLYSVDAQKQIHSLLGILDDLYDLDIDFKVFELGSLAIASGCRMNDYSLFSLSTIITGLPFPTNLEMMDQNWGKDEKDLNTIVKKYLKAKLQLMYDIYSVLFGALLRNIFPDPDITLAVTELSQPAFIAWFSEFVATSLVGTRIPLDVYKESTRVDMLLKIENNHRVDMLLKIENNHNLFGILLDLISNVPVINKGGERFLHHARFIFIQLYPDLSRIRLPSYSGETPNLCKNLDKESSQLMFKRDSNQGDSGKATTGLGLVAGPHINDSLYDLDLDSDLTVLYKPNKDITSVLKEWGRLNVDKIPELFRKLRNMTTDQIARFWFQRMNIYAYLSNLYFNIKNTRITVFTLEQSLMIRKQNVEVGYTNDLAKATRVLQKREQRLNVLHHDTGASSSTQKYAVHQRVHTVVPGDFTKKNKLKGQAKKRRLERAKERKYRNGLVWTSSKSRKINRRINEVKENTAAGTEYEEVELDASDSYASQLDQDDARHVLRRYNSH